MPLLNDFYGSIDVACESVGVSAAYDGDAVWGNGTVRLNNNRFKGCLSVLPVYMKEETVEAILNNRTAKTIVVATLFLFI